MDFKSLLKVERRLVALDYSRNRNELFLGYYDVSQFILEGYELHARKKVEYFSVVGYCRGLKISKDGNAIALLISTEDRSDSSLYVFNLNTEELCLLVENVGDFIFFCWAHDENSLFFTEQKSKSINQIFLESKRLIKHYSSSTVIWGLAASPDGKVLIFGEGYFGSLTAKHLDISTGFAELFANNCISVNAIAFSNNCFSQDGRFFSFAAVRDNYQDIGLLNIESNGVTWVITSDKNKNPKQFLSTSNKLVYNELALGRYGLWIIDTITGKKMDLSASSTKNYGMSFWISDTKIISNACDYNSNNEIWISDYETLKFELLEELSLPSFPNLTKPREISYSTFDGHQIYAFFYPSKIPSNRAVVQLHGGPQMHRYVSINPYVELLTHKGFSVLLPDYRGSSGDGLKFQQLNNNDMGGGDTKDVVWAAKWLVSEGIADADKIGLFGSSYGGYLTLMAVSKYPEYWKAGVAISALWDLVDSYNKGHRVIVDMYHDKLGYLEDDFDLFFDRSPINFMEKCSATMMLVHGRHDKRCPIDDITELERKLGSNHFETVIYEDEAHSVVRAKNKVDLYKRIQSFFLKQLV